MQQSETWQPTTVQQYGTWRPCQVDFRNSTSRIDGVHGPPDFELGSHVKKVTRQSIFENAARKLRQDFQELGSVTHAASKGAEAERLIRKFLGEHLPKRFGVGAGFVIDPNERISRQTDVIIFDALNCPTYRESEDAAIFPSDNVAGAIEVKSRLDSKEFEDAFRKIAALKSLAKTKIPETIPGPVSTQTYGCIFAFESSITMKKISELYFDLTREHGLGRHPDLIGILDRGVITLTAKMRGMSDWVTMLVMEGAGGSQGEGSHIGISCHEIGDQTLDYFLRLLITALSNFRQWVYNPGFEWNKTPSEGQAMIRYLTSITMEKDPEKRDLILRKYQEQVELEFSKRPKP